MTLVAVGLLSGMLGLVWVMIVEVLQSNHQTEGDSQRDQDKPVVALSCCESRAA
jgi:hypothetical protein